MATTHFTDRVTPVVADWLNDVDEAVYNPPVAAYGTELSKSYRMGLTYGQLDTTVRGSYMFSSFSTFPNKLGVNNTRPIIEPTTGARADDTGYVAGTAEVSAILAGYDNVNNALAGLIASQHSMLYAGAEHCTILGGSLHTISDDTDYAVILGGSSNTIAARGRYAAIIGGDLNLIETGPSDSEGGFRAFIATSSECTIGGRNGIILGGVGCEIQATYGSVFAGELITLADGTHMAAGGSSITMGATTPAPYSFAWGLTHTINGGRCAVFGEGHTVGSGHDYCTSFGFRTSTPSTGTHVFSARQRGGTVGRNQAVSWTASQETADATLTRLSISGSANYAIQPADSIVNGICQIVGVNTADGTTSSFEVTFTSKRVGSGTPTLVYNNTVTRVNALSIVTVPTMDATSAGAYRIGVVGLAATNIAWDAVMHGHQIVYTP